MEVSPSTSSSKAPAKRARSAPVPVLKAVAPDAVKKPAIRKAKKAVVVKPSPAEITHMIAMAAYFIAAERGFSPGSEMEDWLQAEKQVLALYS